MSETNNREFMKSDFAESVHQRSDQAKGVPFPPLQKEIPEGASISINLPDPDPGLIQKKDYFQLLQDRQSWRQYSEESLSLEELSYLLFCTQGVITEIGEGYASRRPVPSAGARHPYETYLAINRVEGLEPGLYRYLPFDRATWIMPIKICCLMPAISARTCTWLQSRLALAPAQWALMTRPHLTLSSIWTVRMNTWFTWLQWVRFSPLHASRNCPGERVFYCSISIVN